MDTKKKNQRLAILIGSFIVLIAALGIIWWQFSPKPTAGDKHITISVTYEDGREEVFPLDTDAQYLKEAADTVLKIEGEESEYGFVVLTINGVTANFNTGSTYWAIYVNGEYGNYGIDQQPVTDGDRYDFKVEEMAAYG